MNFRLTKKEKLLKDERDMFSLLIIERFFYIYMCVYGRNYWFKLREHF